MVSETESNVDNAAIEQWPRSFGAVDGSCCVVDPPPLFLSGVDGATLSRGTRLTVTAERGTTG
jgi:hypothetical protein